MVLDAESGEVTIANAAHKEALDYYVSLLPFAPTGAAQLDWAGAQNLFYQGNLAMMRFWGHAYRGTPDNSVGEGLHRRGPDRRARRCHRHAWRVVPLRPRVRLQHRGQKEFIQFAYEHNDLSADTSLGLVARKSAFESEERRGRLRELPRPARHPERTADPSRPATAGVSRRSSTRCSRRCCRRPSNRARTTPPCSRRPSRRSKRSSGDRSRTRTRSTTTARTAPSGPPPPSSPRGRGGRFETAPARPAMPIGRPHAASD